MKVTKFPKKKNNVTSARFFGIALNGVMFIPETAGCLDKIHRGKTKCKWNKEAIVNGKLLLGLEMNNAHVQRSGMYHYHGIPTGLIDRLKVDISSNDLIKVGLAGDGFSIYISNGNRFKSSYQLRKGKRTHGPFGAYDGTYTEDFMFVFGSGDLDKCNGVEVGGNYIYIITKGFPYIPRCWVGNPDPSFLRRPDNRNN